MTAAATITIERVPFESLGDEWHPLVGAGYHPDYLGIFELYDEVSTAEAKIDRMRRWGQGIVAWAARDGRRLVGILTGDLDGHRLMIYDFFVLPEAQRRGIGRALLDAALAEPGLRAVAAEVNAANAAPRALFASRGFREARAIGWYVLSLEPGGTPDAPPSPIRPMTMADYNAVLALMRGTPGVAVRAADSPEAISRYLARNPGLSLVAERDGRLVGCLFCGHDGRRGTLHHVVVAPEYRGRGIGRALVTKALDGLEALGIYKTHLDVFVDNEAALAYWAHTGWQRRDDIARFSFNRSADDNV